MQRSTLVELIPDAKPKSQCNNLIKQSSENTKIGKKELKSVLKKDSLNMPIINFTNLKSFAQIEKYQY